VNEVDLQELDVRVGRQVPADPLDHIGDPHTGARRAGVTEVVSCDVREWIHVGCRRWCPEPPAHVDRVVVFPLAIVAENDMRGVSSATSSPPAAAWPADEGPGGSHSPFVLW